MNLSNRIETSNADSPIRQFGNSVISISRQGFSLVEMLVVIGIIIVLIGASIGGYSAMTRSAEKAKAQELVANVATALTALYQQEGNWPKRLATNGSSDGRLDERVALALASDDQRSKQGYLSLSTIGSGTGRKLSGPDRFGIVSPWATAVIKRRGSAAQLSDRVTGRSTVQDHILHYAIDVDGDGIIRGANVGGQSINIRATAAVWCAGRDGVVDPYPYTSGGSGQRGRSKGASSGGRSDDVYSWTAGQTREVN